jgi:hypothetical protein
MHFRPQDAEAWRERQKMAQGPPVADQNNPAVFILLGSHYGNNVHKA